MSGCTVSNGGTGCLSISGKNSSATNNVVFGCGSDGISLGGGNIQTLTRANVSAVGNMISNVSRIRRTYTPCVAFSGVGLYVANNTCAHTPHTGMTGSGLYHLFEYNTLTHIAYECTDTGAFYVGRSWAQRGNVFRYGLFDTVRPTERLAQQSCSQNAFYLDDEMSGWDFYGNTIRNSTVGVLIGGGRRNRIHDNTFIDNDNDIHFDDRGMNWQSVSCHFNCSASLGTSCFRVALEAVHYQQPPYSTAFPELVNIYQDHPCLPINNVIEDNRYCHTHSKDGGQFIDRTDSVVNGWMSSMSNNREDCSGVV